MKQESTEDAVVVWAKRIMSDYNRKAPKTAATKQKDRSLNIWFCWSCSNLGCFNQSETQTLLETGSARCCRVAGYVLPGLLHVLVGPKDDHPARPRLPSARPNHGDVGARVPWMQNGGVTGKIPQHSRVSHSRALKLCGFQNPHYFFLDFGFGRNLANTENKWLGYPPSPKPANSSVVFKNRTTLNHIWGMAQSVVLYLYSHLLNGWKPQHSRNMVKKTATFQEHGKNKPQHSRNMGKKTQHSRNMGKNFSKNRSIW